MTILERKLSTRLAGLPWWVSGLIPLLALGPAFRDAAPHHDSTRREERLYYEGRFHWNDAGNALAAASVHDFLGNLGGSGRTMAP